MQQNDPQGWLSLFLMDQKYSKLMKVIELETSFGLL